jgi:hypothetical protein
VYFSLSFKATAGGAASAGGTTDGAGFGALAAAGAGGTVVGGTVAQALRVATATIVRYKHRKYLENESIGKMCPTLPCLSTVRVGVKFQIMRKLQLLIP